MPRLPTAEELGRPADTGPRGGIARIRAPNVQGLTSGYDAGVQSFARSISGIGADLASVANVVQQEKDEQDALDLMRAESEAKIKKYELEQQFGNDPDYETAPQRYA